MKAAQITEYGHADKIVVQDAPKPSPAEGQVLVEVHAVALNPFDAKLRAWWWSSALAYRRA